jgi:hypothetical protein
MPLTLEQYADYLDTRDLVWPAPPEPDPVKAKPHLSPLPEIRVVLWNVYGTLLSITEAELKYAVDNQLMLDVALDKTIHEFKMWQSMSRKPGQPAEYLRELYNRELNLLRLAPGGSERFPEILVERIWENLIKKLFQKEYKFDAGFYGSLNEYSKKVAYFFHASMQGIAAYSKAATTIQRLSEKGVTQGLLADGQCFTYVQLKRAIRKQEEQAPDINLDEMIPTSYRVFSSDRRARKPSGNLFRFALDELRDQGLEPKEVLHIGSNLTRDIGPAKRLGMRTALFTGDRHSLSATPDQLKDAQFRPDLMITELSQLVDVIG